MKTRATPMYELMSVVDYANRQGATKVTIEIPPSFPEQLPKQPDFSPYFGHCTISIAHLQKVFLSPRYGVVGGLDGVLLGDTTLPDYANAARKYLRRPSNPEVISTPVILMGGEHNYYHWMLNWFSKLFAINQAYEKSRSLPVVVKGPLRSFQSETLIAAGFSRVLSISNDDAVLFDDALVPNLLPNPVHSKAHIDWIRSLFLKQKSRVAGRRMFISRKDAEKGNRQILNGNALEALLKEYGFETIALAEYTVNEQAEMFRDADYIVSPHGAGLANLIFASEGVTVCELQAHDHYTKVFWSIALQSRCKRYDILKCQCSGEVPGYQKDITADLKEMEQVLKRWGLDRF